MALEIKISQSLRTSQQLVMTPQLQQAIKILQLSLPELEAVVQSELDANPMLEPLDQSVAEAAANSDGEQGDVAAPDGEPLAPEPEPGAEAATDGEWEPGRLDEPIGPTVSTEAPDAASEINGTDRLDKLDWREYLENYSNNWQNGEPPDPDDERRQTLENTLTRKTSLEDHLMWQLRMSSLSATDQRIGATIIYNLSDDGYLETPVEELAAQLEIDPDQVTRVLKRIQRFDPPGVGARNLRESLYAQLANHGMEESLAARVVLNHLDLLEKHRYNDIAKALGVPLEMVGEAAKVISLLEPKPGRDYGGQDAAYIVPDVFIQKVGNDFVVTLNESAVPRLRLANYYQRVLNDGAVASETKEYLQERLRSARWLVKSIFQRQQTIFKVANSIIKFQRAFFENGISQLKPLVLKDVAEDIGMHESTISRATANKYAHTPQGIFELKFFFTSGVKAADGEDVSAETVKEKIRALVGAERDEPLSDQAIADILRRDQINIARRTVAKYRQALGILPSSRRKKFG
ncbi:MAG TPA: RNA polymerase factor sigma-54 [Candidatus Binataceae bacterium]|jgi:RNA polymerase sigma-54 factor|nr:RNA polymerase factor sigma-54 [Candidatus Binataceae bacterium]